MDLSLSDEQVMLRDTLTRYLAQSFAFDPHRPRDAKALWQALGRDLGVLGAALPAEAGGLGGGAVETMVIADALGEALAPVPYIETAVIAAGLLRRASGERAGALLPQLADGSVRAVLAAGEADSRQALEAVSTIARQSGNGWTLDGEKVVVAGAPGADWLLVTARTAGSARDVRRVSLFLVPADAVGLSRHDYALIDGLPASDLTFTAVTVPADALLGEEGSALPLLEQARDEGIAALCAEAAGLARKMLNDTVAYTKEREQFGQPLASFQALQHRMVDMFIAAEQATSAAYLAALHVEGPAAQRSRAVAAAKATVSDAVRFVGQNAVQLHGGMGMTDELAVGHYFRRATAIEQQFGATDHHAKRYAALMRQELAI
ncbi:acyl-CoA dehydrogenase family protein [Sphingomonas sp.]|jgi:alkylation response protein AidB-like acyl-CoA dehydrogenase|uniref:acyl-CoA dehydrogenase family protein n=1 Tax=Sphingomonas sp. TaxID=28214 RepID=UPI00262D03B1|nr:acyl-CoA dehydrogenase family protein [Sphingomonas sp.]MDF2493996.1 pimeloyl-CoA dehydrogenase small subunit [Sphingomonas sp.]